MAQIGTIRIQTQNNGTVSVPVFDTGDSGSSVFEFVRVQTGSGTGFIPVVDTADASFPYIRVQSQNKGVVAVHNDSSLIKPIDDFSDGDISEYTGNTGSAQVINEPTDRPVLDTNSLELFTSGGSEYIFSSPGNGLNYPKIGDNITGYMIAPKGQDAHFGICVQGDNPRGSNGYYFGILPQRGAWGIVGGSGAFFSDDSNSDKVDTRVDQNQWYEFEITTDSSTVSATLTDLSGETSPGTASVSTRGFTSGGIMWYANQNNTNSNVRYNGWKIL